MNNPMDALNKRRKDLLALMRHKEVPHSQLPPLPIPVDEKHILLPARKHDTTLLLAIGDNGNFTLKGTTYPSDISPSRSGPISDDDLEQRLKDLEKHGIEVTEHSNEMQKHLDEIRDQIPEDLDPTRLYQLLDHYPHILAKAEVLKQHVPCYFLSASGHKHMQDMLDLIPRTMTKEVFDYSQDVFKQWESHLAPTVRDTMPNYHQLTTSQPALPFLWSKKIAQNPKLFTWFQRYPTALMRMLQACIHPQNDLARELSQYNTSKLTHGFIVPKIFEMIENGEHDNRILRLLDPPVLNRDSSPGALIQSGGITRELTPKERKIAASRPYSWHQKVFHQMRQISSDYFHAIDVTNFGARINVLDAVNTTRFMDTIEPCLDWSNGELLEEEQFIVHYFTSTRGPHNKKAYHNNTQPILTTLNDDEETLQIQPMSDPRQAVLQQMKRENRQGDYSHGCEIIKDFLIEKNDVILSLHGNNVIDFNHQTFPAGLLMKMTRTFQRRLGAEIQDAIHQAETLKIAELAKKSHTIKTSDMKWLSPDLQRFAPEGWEITALEHPDQLRFEGQTMKHCVGQYVSACLHKDHPSHIYHVEIPNGKPITFEMKHDLKRKNLVLHQASCKANKNPPKEHEDQINHMILQLSGNITTQEIEAQRKKRAIASKNITQMKNDKPLAAIEAGRKAARDLWLREFPQLKSLQPRIDKSRLSL